MGKVTVIFAIIISSILFLGCVGPKQDSVKSSQYSYDREIRFTGGSYKGAGESLNGVITYFTDQKETIFSFSGSRKISASGNEVSNQIEAHYAFDYETAEPREINDSAFLDLEQDLQRPTIFSNWTEIAKSDGSVQVISEQSIKSSFCPPSSNAQISYLLQMRDAESGAASTMDILQCLGTGYYYSNDTYKDIQLLAYRLEQNTSLGNDTIVMTAESRLLGSS
ncbi:MAG: hypothetical protein WCT52_05840 [Candidatus Micrarchaeia archaeon]